MTEPVIVRHEYGGVIPVTRINDTKHTFKYFFLRNTFQSDSESFYIYNSAGSELLTRFQVTVNQTIRRITDVTPSSAKRGELTTFTITGENLPNNAKILIASND